MPRKAQPIVSGWIPPPLEGTLLAKRLKNVSMKQLVYDEPFTPKIGRSPVCRIEAVLPPYEKEDYQIRFEPNGVIIYERGEREPLRPPTGFVINIDNIERLIPLWPACVHLEPKSAERTPCWSYQLTVFCAWTQDETTVRRCETCQRKQLLE
jgi:hypothetical protein